MQSTERWVPPAIVQLMDRVEANLEAPWTLERMADAACFSPFHFHRLFSEAVGETAVAFLERLRLERAALLLLASEAPITELALVVGYRRPETFARRFRHRFECSARGYRRQQIQLWSDLGLDAGEDPLGRPGEIRVVSLPPLTVEVRRRLGEEIGFTFASSEEPWRRWSPLESEQGRIGALLDWPGVAPPGKVRQDWGRPLDERRLTEGWVRRVVGNGLYASLSVEGDGPVPVTIPQRLFVWAMAGRYRLRPGPILEMQTDGGLSVFQPVSDTKGERTA